MDLRKAVMDNMKSLGFNEIKDNINEAINTKAESSLPGLGVLFEAYYCSLDHQSQDDIVNKLQQLLN